MKIRRISTKNHQAHILIVFINYINLDDNQWKGENLMKTFKIICITIVIIILLIGIIIKIKGKKTIKKKNIHRIKVIDRDKERKSFIK